MDNIKYNHVWNIWNEMPDGITKNNYKITDVDPAKAKVDIGTPAFRNKPNAIKGYRKTLECCDITDPRKKRVTDIYEDEYTNCNCDISFNNRSKQPIIKSGMQHKQLPKYLKEAKDINIYQNNITAATIDVAAKLLLRDNAKSTLDLITATALIPAAQAALDTANANLEAAKKVEQEAKDLHQKMLKPVKVEYAYSYREYLINKKKTGENQIMNGGKNYCKDQQCIPKYDGGFQNYTGNGAVTSGLRITNLKFNAIKGGSRCADDPTKCNGVYFAGKPRWTGWMFNANHPEINFPQLKAKRRTYSLFTGSGLFERKIQKNTNDGRCCGGYTLFDIAGCCQ